MKLTKIVVSYIMKYLLGFFLVFACSTMMFAVAKNTIENYVINQAQREVKEGISNINEMIDKLDILSQTMYQNYNFSKLIYQGENLPKEDILQLKESNTFMKNICAVTEDAPYMFALFKKNDLYLSSTQCSLSFTDYYGTFLIIDLGQGNSADTADLKRYFFNKKEHGHNFLKINSIYYTNDGKGHLLDDALIYMADGVNSPITSLHIFCFVIEREYLVQTILMQELLETGFLYIRDMDTSNELVAYGEIPDNIWEISENITSDTTDARKIQNYYISSTLQNRFNWQIVTGIPVSYIDQQIKPIQQLLMIYLGLGFCAVVGFTLYFSLSRYCGFQKVLYSFPMEEMLSAKDSMVRWNSFNDFDMLTEKVMQLDERRKVYQYQLYELKRQNRAILLENLIKNGVRTPEEQRLIESCFEKVPVYYNIVLIRFIRADLETQEAATIEIVQFLTERHIVLAGNVHSGLSDELFLIEHSSAQESNISEQISVFEELACYIGERYDVILHVGISEIEKGFLNIDKCYEQIKRTVRAQYSFEHENVVKYLAISSDEPVDNPVNVEFLNRLYTMLMCGQYTEVCNELEQLGESYLKQLFEFESHKEQIFYSLLNIFYTVALHLDCKEWREHLPEYMQNMQCLEMIRKFCISANWICNYIIQSKKSQNIDLKDNIRKILVEQYSDPGLSAYSVSKQAGISEKYFYQFWKEQTGETFANTLLNIRLEKAKELLKMTDFSNEKIAVHVGFSTVNTFYRNFQKVTGVTPKIYRDKYLAGRD